MAKLKKKRILITAGATWVKIDDVRIITNRFTGKTGLYLAKALDRQGYEITLLINPHCLGKVEGVTTVYYHYFDEFRKMLCGVLKKTSYDAIIHTAAVSDYKLRGHKRGKIPSGKRSLNFKLIPAEKIIKRIRQLARNSLLIQFKLEVNPKGLIEKAYKSLKANASDFVVANALSDIKDGYKGFVIDRDKKIVRISSKKGLAKALAKAIGRV